MITRVTKRKNQDSKFDLFEPEWVKWFYFAEIMSKSTIFCTQWKNPKSTHLKTWNIIRTLINFHYFANLICYNMQLFCWCFLTATMGSTNLGNQNTTSCTCNIKNKNPLEMKRKTIIDGTCLPVEHFFIIWRWKLEMLCKYDGMWWWNRSATKSKNHLRRISAKEGRWGHLLTSSEKNVSKCAF